MAEEIYRLWLQNGESDWSALAPAVYRDHYGKADGQMGKKLRDRCSRAVKRYEAFNHNDHSTDKGYISPPSREP